MVSLIPSFTMTKYIYLGLSADSKVTFFTQIYVPRTIFWLSLVQFVARIKNLVHTTHNQTWCCTFHVSYYIPLSSLANFLLSIAAHCVIYSNPALNFLRRFPLRNSCYFPNSCLIQNSWDMAHPHNNKYTVPVSCSFCRHSAMSLWTEEFYWNHKPS